MTPALAASLLVVAFLAVYAPAAGHGFVKDDIEWLADSGLHAPSDLVTMFRRAPSGFFRPLVSITFGVDGLLFDRQPLFYGLTNIVLALACAAAVYALARGLALAPWAATLASALWLFNWHGINMAVLWISGRTALVVTLCATLAGAAAVRGRMLIASAWILCALLAKEEAVLLPAALVAWALLFAPAWRWARLLAGAAAAEVVYVTLRSASGAFTPSGAPSFYRFNITLATLLDNGREYLDRTATFTIAILIGWAAISGARRAVFDRRTRSVLVLAALWWSSTLATTIFLPVRSSLYACLPSVGVVLAGAAIVAASAADVDAVARRRAAIAGLVVPWLLWPVYAARNTPLRRQGDLSRDTIDRLREAVPPRASSAVVVIHDDPAMTPSVAAVFGPFLQDAAHLLASPSITVRLDPPGDDGSPPQRALPARADVEFALRGAALVRVR